MKAVVGVLLVLLLGCERDGLQGVTGELEVTPRTLDFEQTFLGFPSERAVVLQNRGRGARTVRVSTAPPFTTAVTEVVVPGGSDVSVQLRFEPTEAGVATGVLLINDTNERLEVTLSGLGVAPPRCTSTAVCEVSTFDALLGRCVATRAAEGATCGDACLTNGTCTGGRCVGSPTDCADTNPCTLDVCVPGTGCQHRPAECAAPGNPCKAARCDPSSGCVESDVRDGTACGARDCVSAQICLLGECKPSAVPDGAACGTASPCQATGTCQQQICQQPAPTLLPLAWRYDLPGELASFRGVHDAAQNLYWLECAFGGLGGTFCNACTLCAATSYTRSGALRFRTVLPMLNPQAPLHHLLVADQLIYATGTTLGAMGSVDGVERWSVELPVNPVGAPDVADTVNISALAADATTVTLTARRMAGQTSRQSALLKLDAASGAVRYVKFYDGALSAPVIDETDALTVLVRPWYLPPPLTRPHVLFSLSASGVERWRVTAPATRPRGLSPPVAVFQGELTLEDGELRSMLDGAVLAAAPSGEFINNPLMGTSGRVLLRTPTSGDRVNALALGRGAAQPAWESLVTMLHGSPFLTDSVATASGGLLVAAGDTRHPTLLKAFDGAGAERFACEVPWSVFDPLPVALLQDRWVVFVPRYLQPPRLEVFEVPGELPATRGWVGAHGAGTGSNRPLP